MATHGKTAVDVAEMHQAAIAADTAIVGLRQAISEVGTHVTNTEAGWSSQGARYFRQVMHEFRHEYELMIKDLQDIQIALRANKDQYQATIVAEQENANRFNGLLSI